MASVNYSDSDESFNGFNSDDINDYQDTGNVINDSDLDVSSTGSSHVDDGQSDIDILSLEPSDNNDDASSQLGIESTVENNDDDGEDLFTYTPVWTTDLHDFVVPYFTSYTGSLLPPDFDRATSGPIEYLNLLYTKYPCRLVTHTNSY